MTIQKRFSLIIFLADANTLGRDLLDAQKFNASSHIEAFREMQDFIGWALANTRNHFLSSRDDKLYLFLQ